MLSRFLLTSLLSLAPVVGPLAATACTPTDWPLWTQFKQHFVQDSGRVLDGSTEMQHSSSEGQSYGMVFALLANDKATFDQLWSWSVDNLAGGDMGQRLPAWIWGHSEDEKWEVIDANSASDADVWFTYALLEAGRLWQDERYTQAAIKLLALIEAQEVVDLPELGPMLLPGKDSFVKSETSWQLNASYLPIPVLRRLASVSEHSVWKNMPNSSLTFLEQAAPKGLIADWTYYAQEQGRYQFMVDPDKGPTGSYDAIRVYMWAGMTHAKDPLALPALKAVSGMASLMKTEQRVVPPEKVNVETGAAEGEGPFGFSAALLPYFTALKNTEQAQWQRERTQVDLRAALQPIRTENKQPPYYDLVLSLFGLGWADGYYQFDQTGKLITKWEKACQPARNG